MKKYLVFLLAFACGLSSLKAQSTIDTLYYDKDWKGVPEAAFATYHRITNTPADPNFPKKFKDINVRENYLYAEGSFVSIDKYDDSKSLYTSLYTCYFPNGQVKFIANFEEGKLNGASKEYSESGELLKEANYKDGSLNGLCTTYYLNRNVETAAMYENGVMCGKFVSYTEDGKVLRNGEVYDNKFTGTLNTYSNSGALSTTEEYKSDILDGVCTAYYPNGDVCVVAPFSNGLFNGMVKKYNTSGLVIEEIPYENGLKCGACEYRDGDNSRRIIYKKIVSNDGEFGISAAIVNSNYEIYNANKIRTTGGCKMYFSGYQTYFKEIGLSILNNTDKDIKAHISNITVEYIKKDVPSKNMLLAEETAMGIYKDYAEIISKRAYANAEATANAAATQRTQTVSSGYGNSSSSAASSTTTNSKAAAIGALLGAVANNNGYAAAGGAVGGAKSASTSNTSSQAYGSSSSSSRTNSTGVYVDGQVKYQVYQQEKVKADKISEDANVFASKKIEDTKCSEFMVPAHSTVDKIILIASTKKKYDSIKLSFDYNGQRYSVVWD